MDRLPDYSNRHCDTIKHFKSPYQKALHFLKVDFKEVYTNPDGDDLEWYCDVATQLLEDHFSYMSKFREESDVTAVSEYMFITISPPQEISLSQSISYFHKFIKKTNFKEYLYVIEQRGETDLTVGHGHHYHFLVRTSYDRLSHLRRDTHNSFKNIINIDNPSINSIINFKNCKDITDVKNRISYMTGVKQDVSKHIRQEYDVKFRKLNNLLPYYDKGLLSSIS